MESLHIIGIIILLGILYFVYSNYKTISQPTKDVVVVEEPVYYGYGYGYPYRDYYYGNTNRYRHHRQRPHPRPLRSRR